MSEWKKIAIIAGGFIGAVFGVLYIKNYLNEKKARVLSKEQVVKLLKYLRKEKYGLYKQVATFAVNISTQTRGNINQQAIEQFINGPECPFHFVNDSEKLLAKICEQNNVDVEDFTSSVEKYEKDPEIIAMKEKELMDYKGSLSGKLPNFDVVVPPKLTKTKFYQLQNQITKKSYIQQVRIFKIMNKHSEHEIQQNPSLLSEVGNPDAENQEMLRQQGLDTDFEPALAVYEAAILKFRGDRDFQQKINQLEAGYKAILMRYIQRIQQRTINDAELNQMEEDILYYQPI